MVATAFTLTAVAIPCYVSAASAKAESAHVQEADLSAGTRASDTGAQTSAQTASEVSSAPEDDRESDGQDVQQTEHDTQVSSGALEEDTALTLQTDDLPAQTYAANPDKAAQVQQMKEEATAKINALEYLTAVAKQNYIRQLGTLTEQYEFDNIVNKATAANNEEKAKVEEARKTAIEAIQSLTHLSEEVKQEFITQVNGAFFVTAIEQIVKDASAQNVAAGGIDESLPLDTLKQQVVDYLYSLDGFSEDYLNDYRRKVESAKDTAALKGVLEAIKAAHDSLLSVDSVDWKPQYDLDYLWGTDILDQTVAQETRIENYTNEKFSQIMDLFSQYWVSWDIGYKNLILEVDPTVQKALSGTEDTLMAGYFWNMYVSRAYDEMYERYKAFDDKFWSYACIAHGGRTVKVQCLAPNSAANLGNNNWKIQVEFRIDAKNYDDATRERVEKKVRLKVKEMFSPGGELGEYGAWNDMKTDYEKICAVYRYLLRVEYGGPHNSYGALFQNWAVCDGYSAASGIMFHEAGITSRCIYGLSLSAVPPKNHAWNWVLLGDQWYPYDSTAGGIMLMSFSPDGTYSKSYEIWDEFDVTGDTFKGYPLAMQRYKYDGSNTATEPATWEQKENTDSGIIGDNLRWCLRDGVLKITGTGEMRNFTSPQEVPWKNFLNKSGAITKLEIADTVTSIGENAFAAVSALKWEDYKDQFADKTIGANAFAGQDSAQVPDLDAAKTAAQNKVDALEHLSAQDKESYKQQIQAAVTAEAINNVVAQAETKDAELAQELKEAQDTAAAEIEKLTNLDEDTRNNYITQVRNEKDKNRITEIVNEAKEKDAALAQQAQELQKAKDDAIAAIKLLNYLTEENRNAYIEKVNEATDKTAVETILNEAKAADQQAADQQLAQKREQAIKEIEALPHLGDQADGFVQKVQQATTAEDIDEILAEAKAESERLTQVFAQAQKDAKDAIGKLPHLSAEAVQQFYSRIDTATDAQQVADILAEAQEQSAQLAQELETAKEEAIGTINGLAHLDATLVSGYIAAIGQAESKEAVAQIVAEATAKNEELAEALQTAKDEAKVQIDALSNLSADEKQQYKDRVDKAAAVTDIAGIVEEARAKDTELAEEKALQEAKDNAKQTIALLPHLSEEAVEGYSQRIDRAATTDAVADIVTEAQNESDRLAQELQAAKTEAKAQIDNLANLDTDTKQKYKDEINGAASAADIDAIVERAKAEDAAIAQEKELQEAKDSAIAQINGLYYLTQAGQAQTYIDAVNNAKTTEEVAQQVQAATAKNEELKAAAGLEPAKEEAEQIVNGLHYLDSEKKAEYIKQIESAADKEEINRITETARKENEKLEAAAQALAQAKEKAVEEIKGLTYLASENETQTYVDKVTAAATEDEVAQFLQQAKDKNAALAQQALQEKQQAAKEAIDKLSHMSNEEKQDFKDRVTAAASVEEVEQILAQATEKNAALAAQALAQAKAAAKEDLKAFTYLTPEQAAAYEKEIDQAADEQAVTAIVERARQENADMEEEANRFKISIASDHIQLGGDIAYGTQPQEIAVPITSAGTDTLTGVNVSFASRSGQTFIVKQGNDSIAGGVTDNSWKITWAEDLDAGSYEGTFIVTTDQTEPVTFIAALTITQAAQADAPAALTLKEVTARSVTVNDAVASTAGTAAEYRIRAKGGQWQENWQQETVFNDLQPNTEYEVQARYAGDRNHLPSGESTALSVTTAKAALTVNGTLTAGAEYGTLASDLPIHTDGVTVVDDLGQTVDGQWSWSTAVPAGDLPEVGTTAKYTAVFTPGGNAAQYQDLTQEITPAIAPKVVTVTVSGSADQDVNSISALTAGYTDITQAEQAAAVLYNGSADVPTAVGTYTITVSIADKNYTVGAIAGVQTLTIADRALDQAKADAVTLINALGYLSDAQKAQYAAAVNNALSQTEVEAVAVQAQEENARLETAAFEQRKADVKAAIFAMTYLDEAARQSYAAQVDQTADIAGAELILQTAQAENSRLEAAALLVQAKENASVQLRAMSYLASVTLQAYQQQIQTAASPAAVDAIIAKAAAENGALELTAHKTEATGAIHAMAGLTQEEKTQLVQQVEAASTVAQVQELVQSAQTRSQGNAGQTAAQAASGTLGTANTADVPQTGDNQSYLIYLVTIPVSATAAIVLIFVKRKKHDGQA